MRTAVSTLLTFCPPFPPDSVGCNFDIGRIDLDLHVIFDFRQPGNRRRRGMNAALRFCLRHPLDTMHAAFKLERPERVFPPQGKDHFLESPDAGVVPVHELHLPARPLGEAGIHSI